MKSEGSGNVTGFKLENRSRTLPYSWPNLMVRNKRPKECAMGTDATLVGENLGAVGVDD